MKDSILKTFIIVGLGLILVTSFALISKEIEILSNFDFSYLFNAKIK